MKALINGFERYNLSMNRSELVKMIDRELLDKLFGFCYVRCSSSYEAEELCSDIVFAVVKTANAKKDGTVEDPYSFIWRIARNVYADFSENRRRRSETAYEGSPEDVLPYIAEEEETDDDGEQLAAVYRQIAFLTRAYREVMIQYYIDGLSTAEIARLQNISETAVRQRLFSAREKIKSEVDEMKEAANKPVALDNIEFTIWGTGDPTWGDPRDVAQRQLSKHIVWLCRKKAMSASEIAAELNVPTVYVEEELEILRNGKNGSYGLLRRTEGGKYIINFVFLDKEDIQNAQSVFEEQVPGICDAVADFIDKKKDDYLAFPYLNRKIDLNLILWQQLHSLSNAFSYNAEKILEEKYFKDAGEREARPFSVFGYEYDGRRWGGGCDGTSAKNICGYSEVHAVNIHNSRINAHFYCAHDIGNDPVLQLALQAIHGLSVNVMSENAKEHAAKAIESGYIYRDGDMLYTKILVNRSEDDKDLYNISDQLSKGHFEAEADAAAKKLAPIFKKALPEHILPEWRFALQLAGMPVIDTLAGALIERGILTPPKGVLGAEGCWMSVKE